MTSASSNNISANDGDTSPSSSSSKVSSAAPTSHLGDIMQSASASAVPDMHNMTTSTSLQSITTHIPTHLGFTPLQRILLTANGNVQRILSSYYNSTVSVEILRNDKRPCTSFIIPAVISPTTILLEENGTATSSNSSSYTTDKKSDNLLLVYDRKVRLWCKDRICCTATSTISLTSQHYIRLIEVERVGIGQLFRLCNLLPEFELRSVERKEDKDEFMRSYLLKAPGIECDIHEVFPMDVFEFPQ